jgi:predicted PolB exonuclease-like 3'-5' exonuclease
VKSAMRRRHLELLDRIRDRHGADAFQESAHMRLHPQRPRDDHATERVVCFDIETIVDNEPADGSFPPWPQHKPVSAAFLSASWTPTGYEFDLQTLINYPGQEVQFYEAVDKLLPQGPTGISFNGLGFDLGVLQIGAMEAGCFHLEGLSNQTHAERFGNQHCDLADQFAHYGATRRCSLAELCARLEIPVKTSTHGSEVGELWRAGDIDSIARYVREDVIATWILWTFWSAFRANDETKITLPLDDMANWLERTAVFEHLRNFANCPPVMRARSRAPGLRFAKAVSDTEVRLKRQHDDLAFDREPAIF